MSAENVLTTLRKALSQLKAQRETLDRQIAGIEAVVGGSGRATARAANTGMGRRRRKMTAAQKRAVSRRMKTYWAARRAKK